MLTTVDDTERKYGCENGEYTMLAKVGRKTRWVFYRERYGDFVLEADAHLLSGNGPVEFGFVYRVPSDGNKAYFFGVNPVARSYSSFYYARPDWTPLAAEGSEAIKSGTEKNNLKVVAQGNQTALYVNDQFLDTVTDSNLTLGQVGFYFFTQEANVTVAFDNLQVSKINRPLTLPQGKPRAPTPTPMPAIPDGMGGLIVSNYYGKEINYEIGGKLHKIPANGSVTIYLAPGKHNYSADIPGLGRAGGTIEIELGVYLTQSWADRPG
jgi:hypothetical protein